jgi:quinol-cytochrome oxidoreductase complex cytochrome b subunit
MHDIERFALDLTSPYWWMTVVIVGLVINIASSYFKPFLDRQFSRFSERRRERTRVEYKQVEIEAGLLNKNSSLLIHKGFEEVRWFVLATFLLVCALGLAGLASFLPLATASSTVLSTVRTALYVLAAVLTTVSFWSFGKASDASVVLLKARRIAYTELIELGERGKSSGDQR